MTMTIQQRLESDLLSDARVEYAGDNTVRIWRNNVGAMRAPDGTFIRYGLCVGSSDLIGFKAVQITSEMVGQWLAVFVAAEAKAPKAYPTETQRAFLRTVCELGGRAGVFRTIQEFRDIVEGR
jgi:hypothetical protein